MNTSPEPDATEVHPPNASPTRAAARPFTKTVPDPPDTELVCVGQGLPGSLCAVLESPRRAAPRPFTNTSPDAVAMVNPEQCTTPASPRLAAAGMLSPHEFLETMLPGIDLPMLDISVWRRRYIWGKFDHMIKHLWDVFESCVGLDVAPDHDPKTMRHLSSDDLFGNWSDTSGRLYVAVAHVFASLGHHDPTASI
jgi:hypothetical protein